MTISKNHTKGAFQISRSLFDSHIFCQMPAEYLKIWIYLLGKANHKGHKYNGYYCARGQYHCTYDELVEQLVYKVGYRRNTCHEVRMKHLMKRLMKYLRDELMITSVKKPRGVLVSICNYDTYQVLDNYEKTTEHTNEDTSERTTGELQTHQHRTAINKNVKNAKKTTLFDFESIWKLYKNKEGKSKALIYFNKTVKTQQDYDDIKQALENYNEKTKETQRAFIKHGSTWFKSWRDHIELQEPEVVVPSKSNGRLWSQEDHPGENVY